MNFNSIDHQSNEIIGLEADLFMTLSP